MKSIHFENHNYEKYYQCMIDNKMQNNNIYQFYNKSHNGQKIYMYNNQNKNFQYNKNMFYKIQNKI